VVGVLVLSNLTVLGLAMVFASTMGVSMGNLAKYGSQVAKTQKTYAQSNNTMSFVKNTVDQGSGDQTSMALNAKGNPVFTHRKTVGGIRKVMLSICSDPLCENVVTTREIDSGTVYDAQHPAVTMVPRRLSAEIIGRDGVSGNVVLQKSGNEFNIPAIAYCNRNAQNEFELMYAVCSDASCSDHTIKTLASDVGCGGSDLDIKTDLRGNPIIGWRNVSDRSIQVALCSDTACEGVTVKTVDSDDIVLDRVSLAVDSNGSPVVTYMMAPYGGTNLENSLYVASCRDKECNQWERSEITPLGYGSADIALDEEDNPVVIYSRFVGEDRGLFMTRCRDSACVVHDTQFVDGDLNAPGWYSVYVNAESMPVIAVTHGSYNSARKPYFILCKDYLCTEKSISQVDASTNTGSYVQLSVNPSGQPVIGYFKGKVYYTDMVEVRSAVCTSKNCQMRP
jgi:hypothetical protein